MPRWIQRHALKLLLAALALPVAGVVGDTFFEDDNFRIVDTDLYRAGQLRPDEWSESFDQYHYRSVVNLRGSNPIAPWYVAERSFSDEHGIEHFDFRLSDGIVPTVDAMKELIELMRKAPKPLLVHCQAGADRSGLAAALYLYSVENRSKEVASGQLSLWYGHFPWLWSRTGAMDRAFERFAAS